jgi:hypothetical protein
MADYTALYAKNVTLRLMKWFYSGWALKIGKKRCGNTFKGGHNNDIRHYRAIADSPFFMPVYSQAPRIPDYQSTTGTHIGAGEIGARAQNQGV